MSNDQSMTNDQMIKIDQNRSIFENSPVNPLFMRALSPLFRGSDPSQEKYGYCWASKNSKISEKFNCQR